MNCVLCNILQKILKKDIMCIVSFRAVQKQGKATQHELGKVEIIHVMLLIKMSSIT